MRSIAVGLIALVTAQAAGTVRGVVTDAAKNQPIAGASVLLVPSDDPVRALFATTDDRGRFVFANAAPDRYRLRAERDGYLRGDLSPAIVVKGGDASDVALTLTPTAVISGRVTDQFGEPASRVFVRAWVPGRAAVAAEARTNDLGEYRLFDLAPGEYAISAARYPGPSIDTSAQVGAGGALLGATIVTPTPPCPDCPGEGEFRQRISLMLPAAAFIDPRALTGETYPAVFYPGTTDRNAATPVKAAAGARIEAIDLTLVVSR